MFCKMCGVENADGSAFCKNCGINLSAPVAPATPAAVPPVQVTVQPLSTNPVLNAVKKVASSPLFLVAVIVYSLQILLTLINSTTIGARLEMFLYNLLDRFGGNAPYEFYEAVDSISRIGDIPYVLFTVVGLIPTILICIGLWITYSSARNRLSDGMKTSGLTMIKVITIIQLVFSCISLALTEILLMLLVVGVAAEELYNAGVIIAILAFVVIISVAAYVLEIIYLAKIIKSINTAKNTITTALPSDKVSTFVAVWAFISAAGKLFGLASNFLLSAATMTSLICFGILIFKYKSAMRAVGVQQVQQPVQQQTVQQ